MNNKIIITIIVIAVIILGGYLLLKDRQVSVSSLNLSTTPPQEISPTPSIPTTPMPVASETPSNNQNLITYTNFGYSPNTLKVKAGTTVIFKNESTKSMWPASAAHPTHTVYSGTSLQEHCPDTTGTAFDACTGIQPGNSWSFTFKKKGVWKYHDHLSPGDTGTIIVE